MQKFNQIGFVTDYSLLNSLIKIDDLIAFLKINKLTYAGIVDNNLSASIEFYFKCKENNIKPIIGLKIYYQDVSIYLYAKDYLGYKNLLKIHSNKESLTESILTKYSNNIICVVPNSSLNILDKLSFFDNVYLGYSSEKEKVEALLKSDNVVYLKEIRCFTKSDLPYLKYLNMLGGDNRTNYDYSYLDITKEDSESINKFVSLIDIEIPLNNRYIPVYKKDVNSSKFLSVLSHEGLKKRLGKEDEIYTKRLEYELSIIEKMGFVDYFLIVYDYCLYAKKHNCLVGPGRGSAAGSLVCYSIGITDIDPIKYNLMFERFLNPYRVTMPDIDIDFENTKRNIIIDYVKKRYGEKNVALGLTFNTLKSKLVLREVCKLHNVNEDLTNKFVKVIDAKLTLKENLDNEKVKKFLNLYSELSEVYKISLKLEGLKKNISTHAAGVVISSLELDEIIPTIKENDNLLTGITMSYLESLGLLKMDFLGLKNLTIIANILSHANISLKDIDLEDKNVLKMFAEGNTNGIFQYETYAMKSLLLKLKPACFNDLIAAVALVRPGPSSFLEDYILVKEHKKEAKYIHPSLESILKETNGVILYQEQIISILEIIGGFSKSEADLIRRAISKKNEELILENKEKFINGAKKNNVDVDIAEKIYEIIIKFSGYGFNKSHSVAYALIGYQMAYLKHYYPIYFTSEIIQKNKDTVQINNYLTELKRMNYKIKKPDINYSKEDFYVLDNNLVLPLTLIKGINKEISDSVINNAPYKDYFDFVYKNRSILNDKVLAILIKAGALKSLKETCNTLLNNIDNALNYASLNTDDDSLKPVLVKYPEFSDEEISLNELNAYGFYVGNHPASKYQGKDIVKIGDLEDYLFKNIKVVGLVENINLTKTKKNDNMAFISVSDETGKTECVVFKEVYDSLKNINKNDLVFIKGKVSKSFDKCRIIINNIVSKK